MIALAYKDLIEFLNRGEGFEKNNSGERLT